METSIKALKQKQPFSHWVFGVILKFRNIPTTLTHLILVIEIVTFIILCDTSVSNFLKSSSNILNNLSILQKQNYIIVQLILIICIQLLLNVSFIKIIYLLSLNSFSYNNIKSYVIVSLTILSLIIDFCKTVTNLAYFRTKWSQQYNQIKILIVLANILAIVSQKLNIKIIHPIIGIIYLVLYVLRMRFPMSDDKTNMFSEILLLFGVLIMIYKTIQDYATEIEIPYKILGTFVLFLFHFSCKNTFLKDEMKYLQIDMQEIHSNKIFVWIFSKIIKYFQESIYKQTQVQKIKQFITKHITVELPPQLTIKNKQIYLQSIYNLYIQQKNRYQNSIDYLMLLTQFEILINNNIVKALQISNQIQNKIPVNIRIWIMKIELTKLKQFIEYFILKFRTSYKKSSHQQIDMKGFIENTYFVQSTIEAMYSYQILWIGLRDGIDSKTQLQKRINNLIDNVNRVQQTYERIKLKSKYSSLIYNQYLKYVHKDKNLKRRIALDWECSKYETQDCMVYIDSIFICLNQKGQILHVGQNTVGLLGYQNSQLIGVQITKLFPKFITNNDTGSWIQKYIAKIQTQGINKTQQPLQFCVDVNNHIKAIRLKLNIYLLNGKLRLMGSIEIDKNMQRIIAFTKLGKIIGTSNFIGQCDTKMIQQDNQQGIDQILSELEQQAVVQINILINYIMVTDLYKLKKHIINEEQDQNIYIVGNINQDQIEKQFYTTTTHKTKITQKQLHLQQIQEDKLEKMKQHFTSKYQIYKVILRCCYLLVPIVAIFIITFFFNSVVSKRANDKYLYIDLMKNFQRTSTQTVYLAGLNFQLGTTYKTGVDISSVTMFTNPTLQQYVQSFREDLQILNKIKAPPPVKEYFQNRSITSKAQLVLETTMSIYQYLLMDVVANGSSIYFDLISYSSLNFQSLVKNILPPYEIMLLTEIGSKINFYKYSYMISVVSTIALSVIQIVLFFVFNRTYKNQVIDAANSLFEIDEIEVKTYLFNILKYKSIVHCVNKTEKFKSFHMNQTQFNQQLQKDGGIFMITAALQITQKEITSDIMSPISSFTPVSRNDYTAQQLNPTIQPIQYDKQKPKKKRKFTNKSSQFIILMFMIILVTGICINIGLYYRFSITHQYPIKYYLNSIISLKHPFHIYQAVHSCLLQNIYTDYKHLDLLVQIMKNFTFSTNNLKQYDQSLFEGPEFAQFREFKNKIDFLPMCSYMKCKQYVNDLNTTFLLSATKDVLQTQIIYNTSKVQNLHVSDLLRDYRLYYLLVSSKVYLQIFDLLYQKAFDGLMEHARLIQESSNLRLGCQFALLVFVMLLDLFLIVKFLKQRNRIFKTTKLLRQDKDIKLKF